MKDKPIYPHIKSSSKFDGGTSIEIEHSGMTLLEHYAGLAMQGFIEGGTNRFGAFKEHEINIVATDSIRCAKALIDELQKQSNDND